MIAKLLKNVKRFLYRNVELPLKNKSYFASSQHLAEREQAVLKILMQDGIAVLNLDELMDSTLMDVANSEYAQFLSNPQIQQIKSATHSGEKNNPLGYKNYNLRYSSVNPVQAAQSALLQIGLSDTLGKIASAYFKEPAVLRYADYWLSMPIPAAERNFSQNWHRDPEDQQILKVFIYLNTVDENNGAFEYVKGSHSQGTFNTIFPYDKEHPNNYPEEQLLRDAIPQQAFTVNSGSKGTIIICDTHGFHRGGYCKTGDRWLMTFMYNRASLIMSNQYKVKSVSQLTTSQKKYYATFG